MKILRRKLEQGSQQLQGEVLELELEQTLINAFRHDQIEEVKKGQRGADAIQIVRTPVAAELNLSYSSHDERAFSSSSVFFR